jgi:peroxiredoxin
MALTESTMLPLGSKMPAFRLLNTVDDSMLDSASLADQPVLVMFFCNHCPYVIHLSEKIAELSAEWMERGVAVVGISSNDVEEYPADSPEKMKEEVTLRNYGFPYVYDETQEVAHSFTAACTPDFFLFDKSHALVYRGRFDATRPTRIKSGVYESDNPATGEDLAAAVESVLSNIPVAAKQLPSLGCNIKWKTGKQPS